MGTRYQDRRVVGTGKLSRTELLPSSGKGKTGELWGTTMEKEKKESTAEHTANPARDFNETSSSGGRIR